MSIQKYQLTEEGLIKDRPHALLLDAIEKRERCPEAFLFSDNDIKLIYKAREAIIEVTGKYKDIPEENFTEELHAQILADYSAAFGRKRGPIQKLTEKLNTAYYWTASIYEVKIGKKSQGRLVFESYQITTSTPERFPDRIINPDNCPEFFTAKDTAARARALGLDELYLYASKSEISTLQSLGLIFSKIDDAKTATPAELVNDKFLNIVSSQIMNAPSELGASTRKATIKREMTERGRQISIAEYMEKNNVVISLSDVLPNNSILSAADPNTDKLLLLAQYITVKTGKRELYISLDDFMKFRGLTDRKTAIEKAGKAADNLDVLRFRLIDDSPEIKGIKSKLNIHYVQKSAFITQKGRAGSYIYLKWSDDVYEHLLELAGRGQQIEQIDNRVLALPDNQGTAYNIFREMEHHTRRNAGRKNAHVIGVDTLINCCYLLPLYPENSEDAGKENYLRFPSEAPARIIKPFIKGLDFITAGKQKNKDFQLLDRYTFKHKKGGTLTAAELSAALKDYKKFTALNIEYKFVNEPDYEHLIEQKAKQTEKAEKAELKKGKKKN